MNFFSCGVIVASKEGRKRRMRGTEGEGGETYNKINEGRKSSSYMKAVEKENENKRKS